jgi:hypothetical protein
VAQATHIVRVDVVFLEGIRIEKKDDKSSRDRYPRPPQKMKAVVAVARKQKIKSVTALSKNLSRPSLGLGKVGQNISVDTGRYSAVWGSESCSASRKPFLEFEATLDRLDIGNEKQSSLEYMPKDFDLIAALTEDTPHKQKVALPIGIAKVQVSGNRNGEIITMDLPLLNLRQAATLDEDTDVLHGFPLISVLESGAKQVSRKKGEGGLMQRIADYRSQKVPCVADRKVFSSVYRLDPVGDAFMRVRVQVVEINPCLGDFQKRSSKVKSVSISVQGSVEIPNTSHPEAQPDAHGTVVLGPRPTLPVNDDPSKADASDLTMTTESGETFSLTSEDSLLDECDSEAWSTYSRQRKLGGHRFLNGLPSCGETLLSDDWPEPGVNDSFASDDSTHDPSDTSMMDNAYGSYFSVFHIFAGSENRVGFIGSVEKALERAKMARWRCGSEKNIEDHLGSGLPPKFLGWAENGTKGSGRVEEKLHRGKNQKSPFMEILGSSFGRCAFPAPADRKKPNRTDSDNLSPIAVREMKFVERPEFRRRLV